MSRWRKKPGDPQADRALVLLSGGLDSTAALLWALKEYPVVAAVTYFYGQNAANEVDIAARVCSDRGVSWLSRNIGGAVREPWAFAGRRPDGKSKAIMPARNLVLLAAAAGEGAHIWPDPSTGGSRSFALVVGWNKHDRALFPDCSREFKEVARVSCSSAIGVRLDVVAPWHHDTKADIIRWAADQGHMTTIEQTVSCYWGTRCDECDACKERTAAFEEFKDRR
jgi:7-cyano-7-deazaguanine synthase